jgi:hypothetical protein
MPLPVIKRNRKSKSCQSLNSAQKNHQNNSGVVTRGRHYKVVKNHHFVNRSPQPSRKTTSNESRNLSVVSAEKDNQQLWAKIQRLQKIEACWQKGHSNQVFVKVGHRGP